MTDKQNLASALESHFPIIVIETHEEKRAVKLLRSILKSSGYSLLHWNAAQGLRAPLFSSDNLALEPIDGQEDSSPGAGVQLTDPEEMLRKVRESHSRSVVALLDFHPYLTNPKVLRLVKDIAQEYENKRTKLVLISHSLTVPPEIKRLCMTFELNLPDAESIRKILKDEARSWIEEIGNESVKADKGAIDALVNNMLGFTTSDARRFIKNAIYDDGAITHSDVKEIMSAKYELLAESGALSFEYDTANFADIGGFRNLKDWLEKRKQFFLKSTGDSLDVPKGLLLLGVQGCGKSLASKAVAGVWGVPLLRLDLSALYNKYIGESEKNMRNALKTAQRVAPCVLWIDEIEKGIDSSGQDEGTSRRMLGALLTWMAENQHRVFIVATANNIHALPPELIRKGRLDEIFFVDLPDQETREEIVELHIEKRGMPASTFDIGSIARSCEGFSGAELEQIVVSARYSASSKDAPVETRHLLAEIEQTKPLSIVLSEELEQLRAWARDRTVSVD